MNKLFQDPLLTHETSQERSYSLLPLASMDFALIFPYVPSSLQTISKKT